MKKLTEQEVKIAIKAFAFIFIAFLITLLLTSKVEAQETGVLFLKEDVMALDKQNHALAGSGVAFVSYLIFEPNENITEAEAFIYSQGIVLGLGVIKESFDSTGFDFNDIGANQLGALAGGVASFYLRRWAKKRMAKANKRRKLRKKGLHKKKYQALVGKI